MSNKFNELMAFQRETQALGQVAGRLGWDQETMMPAGSGTQRAEEMAAMEAVLHARRGDARVAEWLSEIDPKALGETEKAQLREIKKSYERSQKVPADLATALARVTSQAQGVWAQARADEDVAAFLPVLSEVVDLRRQEGAALADGGDIYDALLADYEPETSASQIAEVFDTMRPRLVALRAACLDAEAPAALEGKFPEAAQIALSTELACTFGYDFNMGRIDKAVHPFSSGSGLDVRITTRVDEGDPFNCFYSTIHEVGHACYEQGVSRDYLLTPIGGGASMGVHESQSRIYENQIGRSEAFTSWLYEQMRDSFGDFGISSAREFYRTVNRVKPGYIRTEADEVQYNLHVMLRFGLERALMAGDLQVGDLEAAWNDRFKADFGYAVDTPSHGVLQDVHWSVGLFGYFPTYALGNVYAGCLNAAMHKAVPGLNAAFAMGDTTGATTWLRENLQTHGALRGPVQTIEHATKESVSAEPLLDYLELKFSDIYAL